MQPTIKLFSLVHICSKLGLTTQNLRKWSIKNELIKFLNTETILKTSWQEPIHRGENANVSTIFWLTKPILLVPEQTRRLDPPSTSAIIVSGCSLNQFFSL